MFDFSCRLIHRVQPYRTWIRWQWICTIFRSGVSGTTRRSVDRSSCGKTALAFRRLAVIAWLPLSQRLSACTILSCPGWRSRIVVRSSPGRTSWWEYVLFSYSSLFLTQIQVGQSVGLLLVLAPSSAKTSTYLSYPQGTMHGCLSVGDFTLLPQIAKGEWRVAARAVDFWRLGQHSSKGVLRYCSGFLSRWHWHPCPYISFRQGVHIYIYILYIYIHPLLRIVPSLSIDYN